jgi:hypothetical protein
LNGVWSATLSEVPLTLSVAGFPLWLLKYERMLALFGSIVLTAYLLQLGVTFRGVVYQSQAAQMGTPLNVYGLPEGEPDGLCVRPSCIDAEYRVKVKYEIFAGS